MNPQQHLWPATLFLVSVAGIGLGYALSHPETVGLCVGNGPGCISQSILFGIGHPLYLSIRWLPFLFLLLVFVPRDIFIAWAKFAWWAALVALFFITGSPPIGNALHYTPDRTQVTAFMAHAFVIVSLLLIAWKYWRTRVKH